MAWSTQYKKNIDCSNPKGFSQKAHCAGRKARQRGEKTMSKSVNEGIIGAADRFVNAFFDGLKRNATNKAIQAAKKNKQVPPKVIQQMEDIEKASKQLQRMLKDLE
jgi:hypothetical protein